MMNKKMGGVLSLALCLVLQSCGLSPQLNHTYSKRNPANVESGTTQSSTLENVNPEGCALYFKTENKCATLSWITEPTRDVEGSFRLFFWNKDQGLAQQPVMEDPAAPVVGVKLWMPEMGHGSGLVKVTEAKDEAGERLEGVFEAAPVYFVMPGKWDIIVQLKDAQGNVIDSSKINYIAN